MLPRLPNPYFRQKRTKRLFRSTLVPNPAQIHAHTLRKDAFQPCIHASIRPSTRGEHGVREMYIADPHCNGYHQARAQQERPPSTRLTHFPSVGADASTVVSLKQSLMKLLHASLLPAFLSRTASHHISSHYSQRHKHHRFRILSIHFHT